MLIKPRHELFRKNLAVALSYSKINKKPPKKLPKISSARMRIMINISKSSSQQITVHLSDLVFSSVKGGLHRML